MKKLKIIHKIGTSYDDNNFWQQYDLSDFIGWNCNHLLSFFKIKPDSKITLPFEIYHSDKEMRN